MNTKTSPVRRGNFTSDYDDKINQECILFRYIIISMLQTDQCVCICFRMQSKDAMETYA